MYVCEGPVLYKEWLQAVAVAGNGTLEKVELETWVCRYRYVGFGKNTVGCRGLHNEHVPLAEFAFVQIVVVVALLPCEALPEPRASLARLLPNQQRHPYLRIRLPSSTSAPPTTCDDARQTFTACAPVGESIKRFITRHCSSLSFPRLIATVRCHGGSVPDYQDTDTTNLTTPACPPCLSSLIP